MPLTPVQKQQLVTAAIRWHLPVEGVDARTPAELRLAFLKRHLPGLVKSYQDSLAAQQRAIDQETISDTDIA